MRPWPGRPRLVRSRAGAWQGLRARSAAGCWGAVTLATRDMACAVRSYHAIGSSDSQLTPSCPSRAALAGGARAPYCFEGL